MASTKKSVVQDVIDNLTQKIINKTLIPGDKLPPEPVLATQMGVARSSVREAIKILSYLGVLESKRSEGTRVCEGFSESMIDPMIYGIVLNQDEDELMELRGITEAGIMRLAIEKFDENKGEKLKSILEEMKKIVANPAQIGAAEEFFRVDNLFHDEISNLGENAMADKISRVVRMLTYSLRYETVKHMFKEGREDELLWAHEKIYDMLEKKQTTGLYDNVKETYFKETIEEVLKSSKYA